MSEMKKKKLFSKPRKIIFTEDFMERVDKAYKHFKKLDIRKMDKQLTKIEDLKKQVIRFTNTVEKVDKGVFKVELNYIEKLIRMLKFNYENDGPQILKDQVYDDMLVVFKIFREEPIEAELVTERAEATTEHEYPQLKGTLDKCKFIVVDSRNSKEFRQSIQRFIEMVIQSYKELRLLTPLRLSVSFKYDGTSAVFILDPDNGKILKVITRGKNNKGVNLINLFKNKYMWNSAGVKANAVQCELMMTNENIKKYSHEADREEEYKNSRGAVTSILTSLDGHKYSKFLDPVPLRAIYKDDEEEIDYDPEVFSTFSLNGKTNIPYNFKTLEFSEKLFDTDYNNILQSILMPIATYINEIAQVRSTLGYQIDGIVISVLNPEIVEYMGRKGDINQYQTAYKFESEEQETTVTDITYTVNRTGKVVPKLHYEPVYFNGTKQTKATLSSRKFMDKLEIGIGDTAIIVYSNDVIPYVAGISHHNGGKTIKFPTLCPVCNHALVEDGAHSYCVNDNCDSRIAKRLTNFIKVLEFRDFSAKFMEKLLDASLVNSFEDILHLDEKTNILINLEGIGFKTIDALVSKLEDLKTNPITDDVLMTALGIAGPKISKNIVSQVRLKDLVQNPEILYEVTINGVEESKKDYINKIKTINNDGEIERLIKILKPKAYVPEVVKDMVCFTGFRDKSLTEQLKEKGVKVVDGTKNIRFMVVPNITHTSKKVTAAHAKGIDVIDIDELKAFYDIN